MLRIVCNTVKAKFNVQALLMIGARGWELDLSNLIKFTQTDMKTN